MEQSEKKVPELTELEQKVLAACRCTEYRDPMENFGGTWVCAVVDGCGLEAQAAGGVLTSLQQKGLITMPRQDRDRALYFTDLGRAACTWYGIGSEAEQDAEPYQVKPAGWTPGGAVEQPAPEPAGAVELITVLEPAAPARAPEAERRGKAEAELLTVYPELTGALAGLHNGEPTRDVAQALCNLVNGAQAALDALLGTSRIDQAKADLDKARRRGATDAALALGVLLLTKQADGPAVAADRAASTLRAVLARYAADGFTPYPHDLLHQAGIPCGPKEGE